MPSLRERFGAWIAGRAATGRIEFHPPSFATYGVGIGGLNQPQHEVLLQESLGFADVATRAIANRLASLNPQVKVTRREQRGTTMDEVLDDHPLKRLLDRPHPNLSRTQLLRLTAQYIVTVGEAYWLKVGTSLGVVSELHPIPPMMVEPELSQGVVTGYGVRDGSGHRHILRPDTVVRMYFPDPEAPWRSEGYLGPSGAFADSLKFASQHLRRHYQHDATPKLALEASEQATPFTREEKEAFATLWRGRYHAREGTAEGAPAILPTGYKVVPLPFQAGNQVVPLLEFWRDEQLMAFGVPRSVLGQVVSGDRSSAETNQFVFDLHTILPIAKLIEEALTLQLAPDFDASIFVEFEPFVADDKEFTLKREAHDLEHGVREINRVLEDRGDDPVEWGEKPTISTKLKVFDPDAIELVPVGPTNGGGMPLEEDDEEADGPEARLHRQVRTAFKQARRVA